MQPSASGAVIDLGSRRAREPADLNRSLQRSVILRLARSASWVVVGIHQLLATARYRRRLARRIGTTN